MMRRCGDRGGAAAYAALATWLVLLGLLAVPPSAWSAGFMLYEQGTPDVGLASAGQGARA
jgi:hypothetical protein